MRNSLTIYLVFSLFIVIGMTACGGSGGGSNNDSTKTNNTTSDLDSLKKVAKADSSKVDTTSEAFKASALVMFSPYTQHIPHFDSAQAFKPTDQLKQEVAKRSETCKDASKQAWKKNEQGFMKCDCGGVENYVIFSPKGEWAYTRHLATDRKLADFQAAMDESNLEFSKEGDNQIFKVVIAKGYWYEVVNTKNDYIWWFDKNLKLDKFELD